MIPNKCSALHQIALIFIGVFCLLGYQLAFAQDGAAAPSLKDVLQAEEGKAGKAETSEVASTKPAVVASFDRLDRQTPRSSVNGLANAVEQGSYDLAMEFLDTRYIPPEVEALGPELARQLKIIAERAIWVGEDVFSDSPQGHPDDGLPAYRDLVTKLNTPEGPVPIYMQRVPGDEKGTYVWKVSNQTVAQLPRLYDLYGYGPIGDQLSQLIPEYRILMLDLWQWLLLMVIVLLALLLAWVLTAGINFFLRRYPSPRSSRIQKFLSGPIRFLIMVIIFRANFELIAPSLEVKALYEAKTLVVFAVAWLIIGISNLVIGRFADHMRKIGNENATVLLRPAGRVLKIAIVFVAAVMWFDNMGYNVTTIVAGLGIGSIAIALAAQKSLENLIGSITLYAAQPVRIGDLCKYDGTFGVVEEIGLRSSKIRTLARTVKHIPNARLSSIEIENYVERDKSLYKHTLRLRIDTTPDQIRYILVKAREMLYAHPMVDPDPARIRFLEFGEYSLDLQIFAYIRTIDFNEFFEVTEDLHLRLMDIVHEAGSGLAVPTRENYVDEGGRPLDQVGRSEAEAKVREWQESGEYYIPRFTEERKEELRSTLEYPQSGSPFGKRDDSVSKDSQSGIK
jgi:MscS family membrane protein